MQDDPKTNIFLEKKVDYKVTNFIYPNLLTTFPLLIIIAAILYIKFDGHIYVNTTHLSFWLATFLFIMICQAILAIWFQKTKYSLKWESLYSKLLVINAGIVGLLWGIAGVMFLPVDAIGQSFILCILGFVAASGLIYLTGSYVAGSAYVTGALLPLAAFLYFIALPVTNNVIYLNITLGVIYFWVFLLAVNYYGSKFYTANIALRLVNKKLTEELAHANENFEKMNLQLNKKNEEIFLSTIHEQVPGNHLTQFSDPLTQLDTFEVLAIKFIQARAYVRRHHLGLAVFLIDITNFDEVKKTSGEDISNILLMTTALRLQHCKRETDLLSQYKDNKFIMVISEILLGNEIKAVINRIFKTFAEEISINKNKIMINANIGISLLPMDGINLQELIEKCEIALSNSTMDESSPQFYSQIYNRKTMKLDDKNKI